MDKRLNVKKSIGLTLIELMVAMVIGLIVVGAAGQVFLSGRQAYGDIARVAALQESVGFLSEFMATELRGVDGVTWNDDTGRLTLLSSNCLDAGNQVNARYQVSDGAFRVECPSGTENFQPMLGGNNANVQFVSFNVVCLGMIGSPPALGILADCDDPLFPAYAVRLEIELAISGMNENQNLVLEYALRNNILQAVQAN